jgi:hypothetical protein
MKAEKKGRGWIVDKARRTLVSLDRRFRKTPDRRTAKTAFEVATEHRVLSNLSLVGLYIDRWQKKNRSHFTLSNEGLLWLLDDMGLLVRRHGLKTSKRAIETVFQMNWVTSEQLKFLLNIDTFSKYVVPEMSKRRKVGQEQTEWTGPRGSVGSERVEL